MGFLVGVNLRMNSQVSLGVEALTAHVAVEGFLVGVCPQVENQARLEAELLPALGAGIFLLPGVCGEVAPQVVGSDEGLSTHVAFVRLLSCVYLHVLPPPAALHKPPAAVLADKRAVARVGAHVIPQTLRCAQLLATLGTLHPRVQTDGRVLGLRVLSFITQMRPLTPRGLETLPTVGAAQVASSGHHRHVVPSLAMILQILQVLEATGAGRAGVEAAGRGRRVGFPDVDPQVDLGVEGAATHSAAVLGEDVQRVAGQAGFQLGQVLFLMDPLNVFLQEVQVSE